MLPRNHIILGFIIAVFLFILFPSFGLVSVALFWLSSFLVDFDHYLFFIYYKKSFNLKKAYFWFKEKSKKIEKLKKNKEKYTTGIYIFHGVEPIIICLILGFILSKYFFFVAGGIFFHLILDKIARIKNSRFYPKKTSVILDIMKYSKLIQID